MWYLIMIVSIPDLCTLTYFVKQLIKKFWPDDTNIKQMAPAESFNALIYGSALERDN